MRLDPLCEPRELFDRIRIDFCKGMSSDEEDEFSESLAQVSRQTILRKLREVKEETIGKMPSISIQDAENKIILQFVHCTV